MNGNGEKIFFFTFELLLAGKQERYLMDVICKRYSKRRESVERKKVSRRNERRKNGSPDTKNVELSNKNDFRISFAPSRPGCQLLLTRTSRLISIENCSI